MHVTAYDIALLVELLLRRDAVAAHEHCLDLLHRGIPVTTLITDLIAPAEERVGELWYRNEVSVADEHIATAIAERLLGSLTSIRRPDHERPHVAVACAEGEWHDFAARLVGEALRAQGLHISLLGPSMPARALKTFLERERPDVLAVSCTTALSLDGVISFVHVAHDAGIPVLAGGRAIPSPRRAHTLGADLWAADPAGALELLRHDLPDQLIDPTADTGSAMAVGVDRARWVEQALQALAVLFPGLGSYTPDQIDRTREDFDSIISFLQAATLVGDDELFLEFISWLTSLLEARGVPPVAMALSLRALREAPVASTAVSHVLAGAEVAVGL